MQAEQSAKSLAFFNLKVSGTVEFKQTFMSLCVCQQGDRLGACQNEKNKFEPANMTITLFNKTGFVKAVQCFHDFSGALMFDWDDKPLPSGEYTFMIDCNWNDCALKN